MAWDEDGNECDVLSTFDGGVVVQYMLDSDEETRWSSPTIVKAVYDQPPVVRRAAVAAELDESIKRKRDELYAISKELREAELRNKELLKTLSQNNALQRIADFVDGKITHYLVKNWCGYSVIRREDAKCQSDSKHLRLLSLYGGSKGDLHWNLHRYSDASGGSGNDDQCWPCLSEQEAIDLAKAMISEEIAAMKPNAVMSDTLFEAAKNFGVYITPDVAKARLEKKYMSECSSLVYESRKLEDLKAKCEKLKAELDAIGE